MELMRSDPMVGLQIENINVCNAHCVFCPYPKQKRKHTVMGQELYQKIVDDAATIPIIDGVTITGLGEPMLDPGIFDKVAYTRKVVGAGAPICIYTNGHTVTPAVAKRLAKCGLSMLYVSVNAVTARKRKEIVGLDDYDELVVNIKQSIDAVNGDMLIIVKSIIAKDLWEHDEIEEFEKLWGGKYQDGGRSFQHLEGNWAGRTYKVRTTQTASCSRAMHNIMVLADGRVCLCCQDYEGEVIFGDLNHQTLREIYQTEEYQAVRLAHFEGRRDKLKLCKDCTMI
jgi:radical SAM protein with 4Fe4S-binding SPASM domain